MATVQSSVIVHTAVCECVFTAPLDCELWGESASMPLCEECSVQSKWSKQVVSVEVLADPEAPPAGGQDYSQTILD